MIWPAYVIDDYCTHVYKFGHDPNERTRGRNKIERKTVGLPESVLSRL